MALKEMAQLRKDAPTATAEDFKRFEEMKFDDDSELRPPNDDADLDIDESKPASK